VKHLKHVEDRLTPEQRRTIPPGEIETEAEAAKYIAAMTAVLQSEARAEQVAETSSKVESIRKPLNKAKKHRTNTPAAGRKLSLAASAAGGKKKPAKPSKKAANEKKKAVSKAEKKTRGRATKQTATKKAEPSRSRKKR
jgi:hypothetical protein